MRRAGDAGTALASSSTRHGFLRHRSHHDDSELVRRVGAGETAEFATIDERHRPALTRHAGTLLRRSEHDAQDVVQDVLKRERSSLG